MDGRMDRLPRYSPRAGRGSLFSRSPAAAPHVYRSTTRERHHTYPLMLPPRWRPWFASNSLPVSIVALPIARLSPSRGRQAGEAGKTTVGGGHDMPLSVVVIGQGLEPSTQLIAKATIAANAAILTER